MTAFLFAAVLALAAALVATVATARASVRKLAAGSYDVRFFTDASMRLEQREIALRSTIAALDCQRAMDIAIFDGLSEGVVAVDRSRRIVLANQPFAELFESASPVGKGVTEVVRIAAVFQAFDQALTGAESVERFTMRSGPIERTIEIRALPLTSDEIAAVALFIDVTRLERLESLRRNFISDFSHEVRTPLAGLRSAVETYDGTGQLTEAEETQLRRIMLRQLLRLERLVDDLSELSRIESGDLLLAHEIVDLRKLVEELCEDFSDRVAQHRIAFLVDGPHLHACADPLRIQQALSNLIDNAIKYGGDGKAIQISLVDLGTSAEIRVADHGAGIAENEREHIFRRLYRIDRSRSQETVGTGLGLAIVKHLVLQHQGSVHVEGEVGAGATFVVRIPKRHGSSTAR